MKAKELVMMATIVGGLGIFAGLAGNRLNRDAERPLQRACESYQGHTGTNTDIGTIYVFDPENKYARGLDNPPKFQLTINSESIDSQLRESPLEQRYCFEYIRQNPRDVGKLVRILPSSQ